MTWFTTAANETEAAKAHYYLFVAVAMDFPSGFVRLWTGTGVLQIAGNNYLGAGELAHVDIAPERSNLTSETRRYQLSGVDPSLIAESDIDGSFGRSVTEYFGFLNNETHQLLANPEVNFEGEISNMRRIDGASPIIEVNAEHRLVLLDGVDGWRYTHQHQQKFYAGDLGLDKVAEMDTKEVLWGGFRVLPGVYGGNRGDPRRRLR